MQSAQAGTSVPQLEEVARQLRRDVITMLGAAGSGHPGGSLSAADIVAALFFRILNQNPKDPAWPDRDRFILSKGHAAPVLYAALAQRGFIPKEWLSRLRQIDSPLQGHPSVRDLPAVEASTGSLGQGLSIGLGMALAAKMDGKQYRVYVLLGDGESEEGQVWEAAMAAAHFGADNLTAILDMNGFQLDGPTAQIMNPMPQADKWRAFGWHVIEVDGHNMAQVVSALESAREVRGKPTIVIAATVKGKGVSFMENNNEYHGKAPTPEQVEAALRELGGAA